MLGFRMKTVMRFMYLFLLFSMVGMMTAMAAGMDAATAAYSIGITTVVIPPLVGLIKKLKVPVSLVPFVPLLLGTGIQVLLVAIGAVDVSYLVAIAMGLGCGGVSSSAYDAHKAVSTEWNK